MTSLKTALKQHRNLILYIFIGGAAACIDFAFYTLFFAGFHLPAVFSTILSISISTIVGFTLNTHINFKTRDSIFRRFASYGAVSVFALCASSVLLLVLTDIYGFNGLIVKAATLPPIVACQYLLNRNFTFKQKLV